MGVIGVVAALTLPNLNQSTNNQEKVAKVKKIYQNLNDALGRATAVYGPVDEWFVNDSTDNAKTNRMGERLTEFMKLSKNCKMTKGCYESGNGTSTYYQFVLADGTSVGGNSGQYANGGTYIYIFVDIDGLSKGLNKKNRDIFVFRFDSNSGGIEPFRERNMSYYIEELTTDDRSSFGSGWIIDYGNMDYLKLDSNGKCPNGTTPTESNPRCN